MSGRTVRRWNLAQSRSVLLTAAAASLWCARQGQAQEAPTSADEPGKLEEVVVTGTQIAGSKVTTALPVSVVSSEQIAAAGATTGDELLRSIPQMGDATFNSTTGAGSSNFARGDVGSINLRNLGVGNTLVLLNGRRVVTWPGTQADGNLAPVLTVNSNTLPVRGIERLEVLRDGAAAIYGTDAVAGVVNTVLRDKIDGADLTLRYGTPEGTHMGEFDGSMAVGRNLHDGAANVSLLVDYAKRSALSSLDQGFTSTADKRSAFANTSFAGINTLDARSTLSPWGDFTVVGSSGAVKKGSTALTSAAGVFHIQPTSDTGCAVSVGTGICIGTGTRATSGAARNTRSDGQSIYPISVIPELERANLYLTGHYDLADGATAYGEAGYYTSTTRSIQDSVFTIGSTKVTIPASNYWNPFGPAKFADGTVNPNRLAGLSIPASGVPVTLTNYRFGDLGPTIVDNTGHQWRVLGGLRGSAFGFKWDTGLMYSEATLTDVQDGVSSTALQRQLALSTPDAYNPFNGGDPNNPLGVDATPSSAAALQAIRVKTFLNERSTLALWDFKASKADLLHLPGGDLGLAAGTEVRHETYTDDRDPRVDGTINFTDAVTGKTQNDLFGVSPTPDSRGSRTVASLYTEFAVPVVSPEMRIPLVRSVELQLAGRYEHYSDFGSVTKPKIAGAWDLVDGVRLRASWSQGFRAPNLLQMNSGVVTRGNTRTDYIFCEADLRAGRISSFSQCTEQIVATAERSGNPGLKPETSDDSSVGIVLQPKFLPPQMGDFTLTVDYWQINQHGIVGVFGEGNALTLDYLLRLQGSSNPNVIRAAPTADDIAKFAGTGLTPVGQEIYVKDLYQNLNPQRFRGLDVGLMWQLRRTRFGSFTADVEMARLLKYYRQPSAGIQGLLDARAAGAINSGVSITGGGNLLRQNGAPVSKASAAITWNLSHVTVGAFVKYTSDMLDTNLVAADGTYWRVPSQVTGNLYGQYEFSYGRAESIRIRAGVNNMTNENPPLAPGSFGYISSEYQPYARYWYGSVGITF